MPSATGSKADDAHVASDRTWFMSAIDHLKNIVKINESKQWASVVARYAELEQLMGYPANVVRSKPYLFILALTGHVVPEQINVSLSNRPS
jgi:hypothetical protein